MDWWRSFLEVPRSSQGSPTGQEKAPGRSPMVNYGHGGAEGEMQDGHGDRFEGRIEANGLHGSTQPFRFPARGIGNALLQAPEEARQVPVDTRSTTSL